MSKPEETSLLIDDTTITVPAEFSSDAKLFQGWFMKTYMDRFKRLPDILIPESARVCKERKRNIESYYTIVSKTVSEVMFNRDETDMISKKNRSREVVNMRKMVCYIMNRKMGFQVSSLGRLMDKNHATVIHLCKCAEAHMEYDRNFKFVFDSVQRKLVEINVIW